MTRRHLLASSALCCLGLAVAAPAAAQTSPQPTLPSVKFLNGPLIDPASAEGFYGTGLTHSSSFDGISGFEGRPPEIVELARALKNDPDLIYEFVHNQIDTEFAFGLRKGALGALVDKSGTAFDQNVLFVELVRQAGYQARYRLGRVTLQAADFANWTGVSDIQAACKLLASGGIPAAFNGAGASPGDCSVSGGFSSVTILHAWSEVNIGGQWYAFDPSLKAHTGGAGRNLFSDAGLAVGQSAATAAGGSDSGSQSGAAYVHQADTADLDGYLQARGTQLLGALKTSAPDQDTASVVGLTKIAPTYKPSGGWRNASLAGYQADLEIDGDIPDQYRTKLHVNFNVSGTAALDRQLFADEVDGRRIEIDNNFDSDDQANSGHGNYQPLTFQLKVDDVALQSYTCNLGGACAPASNTSGAADSGAVTLSVDHPYAANGGSYGDQTVVKATGLYAPIAILAGFGSASPARLTKWSDERLDDKAMPQGSASPFPCSNNSGEKCVQSHAQSVGDFTRQKLAANWLAQMSRMLQEQSAVGNSSGDHQHSLGVVDSRYTLHGFQYPPQVPNGPPEPNFVGLNDQYTELNVDSAFSIVSRANDRNKANAVSRSVALAAATLEGSLLEQTEDLPDTGSTAARFAWSNNPDNEDPCAAGARRFYDFSGTTSGTRAGLLQFEGSSSGCSAGPTIVGASPSTWTTQLDNTIGAYVAAGFHVTSSAESFLGPGARFGPAEVDLVCAFQTGTCSPYKWNWPSRQRGGALIANKFDGSGNISEVAHVLTSVDGVSKGGGGKQPERFSEYDPRKAADVLKDRFVDRSVELGVDLKTGTVGYTTPVLLSVGAGSAPYGLDYKLTYKAAPAGCTGRFGPCTGPVQGGWDHNWDIRFSNSGSGMEAMGQTSPQPAAGTLVAFLAMQDIYAEGDISDLQKDVFAALVADWWRQQMVGNVATINRGFSGQQYVRLVDGSWMAPIGSPGVLTQTGQRVKVRDACVPSRYAQADPSSTSRRWDHSGVSFSMRNAAGDVLSFAPWTWTPDADDNSCEIYYGYKPTNWTFPQGPSLSFTYDYQQGVTRVDTSLGRSMSFGRDVNGQLSAASSGYTAGQSNGGTANAAGEALTFDFTGNLGRSASQRPIPYPELRHVFEPVNPSAPALEYVYDALGRVKQASDATALQWKTRNPYSYFVADGGRGEHDDPSGAAYAVYYDTDGNAVRHIDELGRETDSQYDGRHRVTSRIYPEGDKDLFGYDANDNTILVTKVAKPGSPLANLVVQAGYDPSWNKLSYLIDAKGNRTDFSYVPAGQPGASQVAQVQRPSADGAAPRPTYSYQYGPVGLVTQDVDPTGVVTAHDYDSFGNPTSTTQGAAASNGQPALNLTTTFTPDAVGDTITVTDPRGNAVTTQYDAMRRKVGEQLRNGGAGALPLAATQWAYDANGRVKEEDRATDFDASGVATGWQKWLSSYTPTGKLTEKTDPLGHVSRTRYDKLDRVSREDDATNRVVGTDYDAAGQVVTEWRAAGISDAAQPLARYTYGLDGEKLTETDARNNTVTFTYEGFNRLSSITHPDGSHEDAVYDPNGNVVTWTNRGGFSLQRGYDALDRKISEKGITNGAANTANRWWDIHDRTFTYDLAGRMLTADSDQWFNHWSYDAAGRVVQYSSDFGAFPYQWDASGNVAQVTYGNGAVVAYGYDALNRMTSASAQLSGQSANPVASLSYDALGRRTQVSFADGSTQTYGYDDADRLISLAHVFPGSPGSNVTFGYGYDDAGREVSRTVSNPTYAFSPAVGSTSYTADALNRYASLSYWPEGAVQGDGTNSFWYDETNNLVYAEDAAGATYTPLDALGQNTFRQRAVPGGQDSLFYVGGAGVRPEEVIDRTYTMPDGGSAWTLFGDREHILGPNPDERLGYVDVAGHLNFVHTDKLGSTIAVSQGGAPFRTMSYGPYGESADPASIPQPNMSTFLYRYTGQRLDPDSRIYHYKARDYSTTLGRFLQPDPRGLNEGPNLYEYARSNPLQFTDPQGTQADNISEFLKDKAVSDQAPKTPSAPGATVAVTFEGGTKGVVSFGGDAGIAVDTKGNVAPITAGSIMAGVGLSGGGKVNLTVANGLIADQKGPFGAANTSVGLVGVTSMAGSSNHGSVTSTTVSFGPGAGYSASAGTSYTNVNPTKPPLASSKVQENLCKTGRNC